MAEKKYIIYWVGVKVELKEGQTVDDVFYGFNEDTMVYKKRISRITNLEGKILKQVGGL
ncbi:hypothetical protein LCGC14_0923270 [marine sediment metagenome]|uniref:Uncharacterized protein n=1 Tax=marine sediment metagenome TaxID=412755 RepID=A0A0F9PAT9_9ZZZZ